MASLVPPLEKTNLQPDTSAKSGTPNSEHGDDFNHSSMDSLEKPPIDAAAAVIGDIKPHDATGNEVDENALPAGTPHSVRTITGIKWIAVVISVLSSTFLFALDNTVVADIQPDIVDNLGEISKLSWLSVGMLMTTVAINLTWGKIYGQLNARWLYLISVFLFEVGSALCGAAPTMNALIGGRVIAGLGAGGMYIGVMTLLSVNTTEHERPMYIGLTGLTWGLGTVLGPIIGGGFAVSKVGWRYAFYINLFVAAVAAPVYIFLIPPFDPRPGVPYKQRLRELDYLGTLLFIGASVSGIMAINFGGVIYAWDSAQIIVCFVVSGVLFIVFGLQQMASAVTIVFVTIYFIPILFQFSRGDSAIEAGVRLLPLVCCMVVAVILNGALMSQFGYYMPWYLGGACLALIGSALMYTVKFDTSDAKIYGYSVLIGIGSGMYAQASFSVAQAKAKPEEIPLAIGFISLAQLAGATIALAIANAVFLNHAIEGILRVIPTASKATVQAAVSGANSRFFTTLDPAIRTAVLQVITSAFTRVYILCITAAALSIVISFLMKREKLFLKTPAAA